MSFWSDFNTVATDYEKLIGGANAFFGLLISIGLFCVAWRANSIAKSNLELAAQEKQNREYRIDKDERDLFRSVYSKISEAKGIVFTEGTVTDAAHELFWKARDQARLELPEDIQEYTQTIFDRMHKAYVLRHIPLAKHEDGGHPAGSDERKAASKEHTGLIKSLMDEQPHEAFAKYMRIKTP
ncbi:MAG: hypothetical protein PHY92_07395 [Alphaproteobacteria bacterium]|nr:hypothetical protein [Alphaproteobacteria bacterium]